MGYSVVSGKTCYRIYSHVDVVGFHNLEKHITSVLVNPESIKPEVISSSGKWLLSPSMISCVKRLLV